MNKPFKSKLTLPPWVTLDHTERPLGPPDSLSERNNSVTPPQDYLSETIFICIRFQWFRVLHKFTSSAIDNFLSDAGEHKTWRYIILGSWTGGPWYKT